jgi:hypothetical protein
MSMRPVATRSTGSAKGVSASSIQPKAGMMGLAEEAATKDMA